MGAAREVQPVRVAIRLRRESFPLVGVAMRWGRDMGRNKK